MAPGGANWKLLVLGQGYVGLPLAIRAVEVGFDVVGFDIDDTIIKRLAAGQSQVEDIASARLQAALDSGRYRPTSSAADGAGFGVAVIAVPTPLRDGNPDLSHIETAGTTIGNLVERGATVVLESTTYPGTTEELLVPLLEEGSGLSAGTDFHVGYSPERLEPGNPTNDLVSTPKLVSGIDADSLRAVQGFYDRLVDTTHVVANPRVAELAKLLENTFRHVNIALVNEIAMFANDLGIDVWEVIDAASTKPFGYMRFEPGPGVGGHCLPIDPSYLSWQVRRRLGLSFRFVELANDINDNMPDYVVRRLTVALNRRRQPVSGSRVLLLGLAYKRNTRDARESPAARITRQLLTLDAGVHVVDPYVDDRWLDPRVTRVELTAEEIGAADAVVVVTDHDAFDYDLVARHARYVLDTRHRMTGEQVEYL
ncbi:MAG TPA: nucleotide sugar dehydrogenase [Acidimicrobiia bacterium]